MIHPYKILLIFTSFTLIFSWSCKSPQPSKDHPPWIEQANLAEQSQRFIVASGSSKTGSTEQNRIKEAESNARLHLAEEIAEYTEETLSTFFGQSQHEFDQNSPEVKDFIETTKRRVSNTILRQSTTPSTWKSEVDNSIHTLYRIPLSRVHSVIKTIANSTIGTLPESTSAGKSDLLLELNSYLDNKLTRKMALASEQEGQDDSHEKSLEPPEWLVTGHDKKYPAEQYVVATGIDNIRLAAEEDARVRVQQKVRAAFSAYIRKVKTLDNHPLHTNIERININDLEPELPSKSAIKIAHLWYDRITNTHYALAALSREKHCNYLQQHAEQLLQTIPELLKAARNHHKADNYRVSLEQYLTAIKNYHTAIQLQLTYLSLRLRGTDVAWEKMWTGKPDYKSINEETVKLLEEFKLVRTATDRKTVRGAVAPPQVKLAAGPLDKPVSNFPLLLTFVPVKGGNKITRKVRTDELGIVTFDIIDNEKSRLPSGTITCSFDLDELNGELHLSKIDFPSLKLNHRLRTRTNTKIAIITHDIASDGSLLPDNRSAGILADALVRANYQCVPFEKVQQSLRRIELSMPPNTREMSQLGHSLASVIEDEKSKNDTTLLVIEGSFRPVLEDSYQTSQGNLLFVVCPVQLHVMDVSPALPEPRIIGTISAKGLAAHTGDRERALQSALVKAAREASKEALNLLNDILLDG